MGHLLGAWIIQHIEIFGYGGVVFLMALESANIPIPSEIVLPFAGFLVAQGKLNFHLAALAGAVGCMLGSVVSYGIGRSVGRTFIERYGSRVWIGSKELALGDRWMGRYGNATSFVSRLLPVVRTFISLLLGVARVPFWPFVLLTFLGSWIWSYVLVYVGVSLGDHWEILEPYWQKFDLVIVGAGVIVVGGYIWHHTRGSTKKGDDSSSP